MGGRKKVRENANITFVFPNGRKCDTLDTLACWRNAGTNVDHHCAHSPVGGCGHIILNTAVLFSPVGGCGHIALNTAVLFSPVGGCGHIVLNTALLLRLWPHYFKYCCTFQPNGRLWPHCSKCCCTFQPNGRLWPNYSKYCCTFQPNGRLWLHCAKYCCSGRLWLHCAKYCSTFQPTGRQCCVCRNSFARKARSSHGWKERKTCWPVSVTFI